jgi:hypothetical protein
VLRAAPHRNVPVTSTLALKKSVVFRFVAVAFLGASAPLWWPWLSAHLATTGYILAGAPERALPPALAWTIVALTQLLVGASVGTVISALPILRAWIVFHVFLLAGAFVLADASAPFHALRTVGGWSFEASLMLALLACRRPSGGPPRIFRGRRGAGEAQAS